MWSLFFTPLHYLDQFPSCVHRKKKKKKISSAHMAAKLLQLTHGADAFFSVNISSSPYFYVLLGSGGEYKKTHVSNVSSTLEPEICHVASK